MSRNRPFVVALGLSCLLLLAGFKVLSPTELRQDLRQELEKIREMTPGAKERALWEEGRRSAEEALEAAELADVPLYAPEAMAEATSLFSLADEYAGKHAYRKATYLARKAEEAAKKATEEANDVLQKRRAAAKAKLGCLREALNGLARSTSSEGDAAREVAELFLALSDLAHAADLEQFDEVERGITALEGRIQMFSDRNRPCGD